MPAGQPTKYNKKMRGQIKSVAIKGFTDKEIAAAVGVTDTTLNNWKIAHPKFFESLKDWKIEADMAVEQSLYKRACGYNQEEKHYPPDPTSMIFWLKNRKTKDWRDRIDNTHSGPDDGPIQLQHTNIDLDSAKKAYNEQKE